ncbi:Ig-like domain-containing protein, partial [Oceanobacillus sp. ISL-74]|uniref:Ig-like domain-containing protein n=1 Tax=Oceanobacillus sp. ISL-74 TaxID=2819162 RepID=UPI001BED26A5
ADADADADLDHLIIDRIDTIYNGATSITGEGEPGSIVNAVVNGEVIGYAFVSNNGEFTIDLDEAVSSGDVVELYQVDENGNKGESTFKQVLSTNNSPNTNTGSNNTDSNNSGSNNSSNTNNDQTLPDTAAGVGTLGAIGLGSILAGALARLAGFFRRK